MKINRKYERVVLFGGIMVGEVFVDDADVPYMKIRSYMDFNAVRLSDGTLFRFEDDDLVDLYSDAVLMLEGERQND